jgi:hypothetical protein
VAILAFLTLRLTAAVIAGDSATSAQVAEIRGSSHFRTSLGRLASANVVPFMECRAYLLRLGPVARCSAKAPQRGTR